MKFLNKTYYVLILLLAGLFSSCSDWLDYNPKDKSTAAQQFASRDGFYAAVNGVYNRLTDSRLYGRNLSYGMIDLMAKRYSVGTNSSTLNYKWANHSYTNQDIETALDELWKEAYATILNVNVILKYADEQNGILSEKDAQLIKGDLLALRAFLHFDMLRLFGPVYSRNPKGMSIPYNNTPEGVSYELLPAEDVIYKYLIPDLNNAENALKAADPVLTEGVLNSNNENGDNYMRYRQLRMNCYAVALLKARVYLWAGDMQNALIEAKKITDDAKVKEFFPFVNSDKLLGNSKDPDRVFSTEVLFGFYYSGRNTVYTDNFDSSNLTVLTGLMQPRTSYVETLFTNQADYRLQSQWNMLGNLYDFVKFKKITYDENNIPFYAFFMPLMRISEAYYIAAEASLGANDLPGARAYLSTILQKRGNSVLGDEVNASAVSDELKKEYMREFLGEGQIFYMFKRNYISMKDLYNADNTSTVAASNARYVLPLPVSEQENR